MERHVGFALALCAGAVGLTLTYLAANALSKTTLQIFNKITLNEHEKAIASDLVLADDIKCSSDDMAGQDKLLQSITETVLHPLQFPELFSSPLLAPPKGVLLYGPPGCGKTMLAKIIAKECGANFINIKGSTLGDKWYGESQKLVRAVFTLAQKLQPCIVFLDEIDSFLRERRSSDHEATAQSKAEFMVLWDGMQSEASSRVVVIGATNRPQDLDAAVLRRLPKRFKVDLPDAAQRTQILRKMIEDVRQARELDGQLAELADRTAGYSGSDLKELCRSAVIRPVIEAIRATKGSASRSRQAQISGSHLADEREALTVRGLVLDDFYQCEFFLERHEYDAILRKQGIQERAAAAVEEALASSLLRPDPSPKTPAMGTPAAPVSRPTSSASPESPSSDDFDDLE